MVSQNLVQYVIIIPLIEVLYTADIFMPACMYYIHYTETFFCRVPEAVAMIANMNKHVRYMHASVGYLRDQLQSNPRLLELGQEVHSVSTLAAQCGDTLKFVQGLHEEIKFFKGHLDKVRVIFIVTLACH